ncbi:MAG TPA: CAP domain-containing protein [Solirubrobacteraceae bacterium]|nr:CAP domain-containing protein [Solirubrobacteraceae bacterium]
MGHRSRTILLAAAAALLAPAALVGPARGAARAAACPGADAAPTAATAAQVRRATLCLLNAERARRGLAPLAPRRPLATAARRHARAMVAGRFFDHTSPGGSTMESRVRRCGYLRGASGWSLGEDIAWGAGGRATPRAIVAAWMRSPPHRANILNPRFRDAGIGVAAGGPVRLPPGAAAGTYVADFGRRAGG